MSFSSLEGEVSRVMVQGDGSWLVHFDDDQKEWRSTGSKNEKEFSLCDILVGRRGIVPKEYFKTQN